MSLYDKASLVLIPSGTKAGTVYSQKPVPRELSSELVTNGGFDADSDWVKGTGYTITSGSLAATNTANNALTYQSKTYPIGIYKVTASVTITNGGARFQIGGAFISESFTTSGLKTVYITVTSQQTYFGINTTVANSNFSIDNISVKEVDIVPADFDFTRSTYATRVNSQGLIEKERSNLLLQSNTFDTTWSNIVTTLTGGQGGYDGGLDAWLLNSTTTGFPRIEQSVTLSGVQTFSIYAKSATDSFIQVRTFGAVSEVWFNLSTGVASTSSGAAYITSKVENIGSGWYRCSLTINGSLTSIRVYPASAIGTYSTSGNGVYIQDAQLEQGLVATDYIETTTSAVYTGITDNVPRLDYDGDCPSLLLEPSRTNLVNRSEYYGNNLIDNITVSTNNATSPEGVQNATLITEDTNTGLHRLREQSNITITKDDSQYVISFFAKSNGRNLKYIDDGYAGSSTIVHFNLSTGQTSNEGSLIVDSNMEDYGNGWYRCSAVVGKASAAQGVFRFTLRLLGGASNDTDSYTGDGTSGVWIYGKQAEDSVSYATSYIPTYGTSVTRNNDSATQNSSYTFGSGAFSLFLEHEPIPVGSGGQVVILRANPLDFYFRWTSDTVLNIWNQEIQQTVLNKAITGGRNQNIKICMVYDGVGSTDVYVNGVKERDGYSFTWPDGPYNIGLDSSVIINGDIPIHISQVMTFETALTNEEAIALTTV